MNSSHAKKRPPLHVLERGVLLAVGLNAVALPWAWAWSRPAAEIGAAILAGVALLLALWPRHYRAEMGDGHDFWIHPWRRLVRFPPFWCGLGLFALVTVQQFNPSCFYETNGMQWWLTPMPHTPWIPKGVEAPFSVGNGWRALCVYGAAWATVCAIWIGVTRRRALQIFSWVMIASAFAVAAFGIWGRMTNQHERHDVVKMWATGKLTIAGYSTFDYRNHAGAYLGLIAGIAVAMAVWEYFEARRRMARSSPAGVWLLLAAALGGALVVSYSRSAMASFTAFLLLAAVATLVLRWKTRDGMPASRTVTIVLTLIVLLNGAFVVSNLNFSSVAKRISEVRGKGLEDGSYIVRVLARERAVRMWKDHWALGTGAGSFVYIFPVYIHDDPRLFQGGKVLWDHAHIDWLEFPIELGVAGTLLIAGAFGWLLLHAWKVGAMRHPFALILLLSASQTLLHALVDFPFFHPSVLILWWTMIVIAVRWAELDPAEPKEPTNFRTLPATMS